jgi:glycosyltransferase involved in cell wall biosynthesis
MPHRNLLIITSAFPYGNNYKGIFIKEQLKHIQYGFNKVYVVSPLSYFPKILLHSNHFKKYSGYSECPINYHFGKVDVFFPRYIPLPVNIDTFMRVRNRIGMLAAKRVLEKKSISFDIIHAHFILPSGYIGAKVKEKFHKPLIITAHGGDVYEAPFKNEKWLEITKDALSNSDRIITTSLRNRDILIGKLEVNKKKITVIRNGFDEDLFFPIDKKLARNRLSLPHNKKILLSIGNFTEIKGHKYLIQSMKNVIQVHKDVLCVIIGHGDRSKLDELIFSLGLSKIVKIINGVPHESIPLWINACDLFILPSLDEGSPTIIPEVWGCGKPVIATSVGGVPELFESNDVGFMVKEKNSEDISNSINLALNREWNTKAIAEYAKQRYTWDLISNEILKVYLKLI